MINTFKGTIIKIFHKYSLPRWLVLVIDASAVFLSFLFAYLLRFNFDPGAVGFNLAFNQAYFVFAVYVIFMLIFKSYSGLIRHTTIKDTFNLFLTNTSALLVLFLLSLLPGNTGWWPLTNIPLSILLIHYGIITVVMFLFRVSIKMFYEFASISSRERRNVIIYGAGEMGIIVKRVIEGDLNSGYRIAALIDDNWKLQGKKVDGVNVYSDAILTDEFISKEKIAVFIFAINNLSPKRKKEILGTVISFGLEVLETPKGSTWLNGQLQVKQLRRIHLEDLLGREPIILDLERIKKGLNNKTIFVTGAAGSIGSEIVRQLTKYNCKTLILIDQAETPSFFLDNELKRKYPDSSCNIIIADVTREEKMEYLFKKYKPEVVFHAAAYKHVPIMESHPHEAFRVNVGGTKIVTELAIRHGVGKFVLVSSDKAVNPTNVMGATKKISELYVQAQSRRASIKTQFVTTRFGNVLGSSGSVIPLFRKQIEEGGPVTVTDPKITRFFMTIPEACQLVLEAGFMGNGGEIYVFDMGEPVKILDLANNLIRLSGLEPGEDIKIEFTGLRPGEKLYEELFSDNEPQQATHHPKISIAKVEEGDFEKIVVKIDRILNDLYGMTGSELVKAMKEIVPEYKNGKWGSAAG